jgi:hypothetical protein
MTTQSPLRLELKAIKHSAFASQETYCYTAKLYVNGKAVAVVGNKGHGGCDDVHPINGNFEDYRNTMKAVYKHFYDMPEVKDEKLNFSMQPDFELWCGEQVTNFLYAKDLKRMLKTKTVVTKDGKCFTLARKDEKTMMMAEGDGYKVLNRLTFDEALTEYIKNSK